MSRFLAIIPLVLLIALAVLGGVKLAAGKSDGFGTSDGRPAPTRRFERLGGGPDLNFSKPEKGEIRLVNLFASWCAPCVVEHPLLMELAAQHPGKLSGVLYEDTAENGAAFLARLGNPFTAIGLDPDGQGGLDFGLTGVPESFVINGDGEIILHVRGPLDTASLATVSAVLAESE